MPIQEFQGGGQLLGEEVQELWERETALQTGENLKGLNVQSDVSWGLTMD